MAKHTMKAQAKVEEKAAEATQPAEAKAAAAGTPEAANLAPTVEAFLQAVATCTKNYVPVPHIGLRAALVLDLGPGSLSAPEYNPKSGDSRPRHARLVASILAAKEAGKGYTVANALADGHRLDDLRWDASPKRGRGPLLTLSAAK